MKCKIVKNKVAPPFQRCEFDIMYNEGISIAGDLLDTGIESGTLDKKGNSYLFGEERLGVGREASKRFLKENPEKLAELRKAVQDTILQVGKPKE